MGSEAPRRRLARKTRIETLEDRQMFSADPLGGGIAHHLIDESAPELHGAPAIEPHADDAPPIAHEAERDADFWYDNSFEEDLEALLGEIDQTLASAHGVTGLTQVRQDYGFTGVGQTVAVIDSGIAYDHWALGGGFGSSYRVVGGWDFTDENDANPYDDGPSGSHGTHVAGIVGGDRAGTADDGVAPGADLVALRVFNDAGDGYFNWVENALQWVHTNRNSFDNPITAVNLSLGTAWNSTTIPSWAMLEDEFAQLETDGIFIAVSAGNSFASYNAPGLSYPAASLHVVPVMSVNDAGFLSSFSQRDTRAIGAPGQFITSTVPDYIGNHNGISDDFASFSGTSMASPYVAGASVIVREAMEFVGYTNITQWTIYNHMMATADDVFDTATNAIYKRLNLSAAIDALMPEDDFGSTADAAFDLGIIGSGGTAVRGTVGKSDDVDFFRFTAAVSGTVTFSVTTTHELDAIWTGDGTASDNGRTYTIDVDAGESYVVGLSSGNGVGYFESSVTLESVAPSFTILKTVVRGDGVVFSLDSDGWLSVNGSRIWENTRDFALTPDGSLHWLGTGGLLARRMSDGSWQALDRDAVEFAFDGAGTIYSRGTDGWININGQRVWENTKDFCLMEDGTIYWQSTNGSLYRRPVGSTWKLVDRNVSRFAIGADGLAYSLRDDHWISVDGASVWENTHEFILTPDQTLYWHSTNGSLHRRPSGGTWQLVSRDVKQFAVCQDGSVYTLADDGQVALNGSPVWTGIAGMRTDQWGRLILEQADDTTCCIAGRFAIGESRVTASGTSDSGDESAAATVSQIAHASMLQDSMATSSFDVAEIATATTTTSNGNRNGNNLATYWALNQRANTYLTHKQTVDLIFSRESSPSWVYKGGAVPAGIFDIESIVEDASKHDAADTLDDAKIGKWSRIVDDVFAQTGSNV